MSAFERVLELARADDPETTVAAAAFLDPELAGELMVQLYRTDTPAARAALAPLLEAPFRRGRWQGFKRVFKLAEAAWDAETFVLQAAVLDRHLGPTWPVSWRTLDYLRRRTYRHFKRVALERPERLLEHVERLLPRYRAQDPSVLLRRLLRLDRLDPTPRATGGRFAPWVEAAAARAPDDAEADALLELSAAELVAPAPAPAPAPAAVAPPEAAPPRRWPGPIFVELWLQEPERLVALLERTRHAQAAGALARLLRERAGERLLAVDLERFYALLAHPVGAAWRLGLAQLAARARRELLRYEELLHVLGRLDPGQLDWDVVADVLWVLDDERAAAAHAGLGPPLRDLLLAHPDAPGVAPVVDLLRRRLDDRLGPPLFGWDEALRLVEARRPDVRELGRLVVARLGAAAPLDEVRRRRLLASPLVEDDPELVHRLLAAPEGVSYRPPDGWSLDALAEALDGLAEPGFRALRRVLLAFEEDGGLDPEVGLRLVARSARRTRALGLELLGGALRRGGLGLEAVAGLAGGRHEDVVVWVREALAGAAADARLPNEALYRLLDASARDVRGFARGLVLEHLERLDAPELIAFCAESPDEATAALGIGLYEEHLAGREGFDLRRLLPMFRILLYRVAAARAEKERVLETLTRWALEDEAQARLVVDVIGAFRRSHARLDFERSVRLLVRLGRRFPGLELPFPTQEAFGFAPAAQEA